MICNTRNRSNNTAEKCSFNAHFHYSQSKIIGLNKMGSLKVLLKSLKVLLPVEIVYMQSSINEC